MITFVYGAPGSGKTHFVFDNATSAVNDGFIIVPEQQTVVSERRAVTDLPKTRQQNVEVLNFTRLCNRVFREYGGLSYRYATKSVESLVMWRTLRELSPMLEVYGSSGNEFTLTDTMLSACAELSACAVTPSALEAAAAKLPDGSLKSKLRDVALICATYTNLLSESYDDKSKDLDKLSELLGKHRFFEGKFVCIDSFTSFTAQETAIISHIFKQASDVVVTLGCDSPESDLICCESIAHTAKSLEALAEKLGKKHERIYLTENFRANNDELRRLPSDFWKVFREPADIPDAERGNVKIIRCRDKYAEADAVVSIIRKELENENGNIGRYKDFAVVARDASLYEGIVDTALSAAGIANYTAKRNDPSVSPAVSFLLSALRINFLGYRKEDVFSFIKTGLCGISPRDADMFEEYVNTWNIHGARFKEPFNMNPDGYVTATSERGARILSAANSVRERIDGLLSPFFDRADAAGTAEETCEAVYRFLTDAGIPDALREISAEELEAGNKRAAYDSAAVWNLLMDMLDDIAAAFSGEKLDAEELYRAACLCLKVASVGSIPTGYDEVTVGSASLLRTESVKCAIIIGMNEGVFPAAVKENNIFGDADRSILNDLGVKLASDSHDRAAEELLYVRRALSLPSDKLYVLYSESSGSGEKQQPSMIVERLTKFYGYLKPVNFPEDKFDTVWTAESALELLSSLPEDPESAGIAKALETHFDGSTPKFIAHEDEALEDGLTDELFGKEIKLSPSSIEKFAKCNFSFYCDLLRLRKQEKAEITGKIYGTFVHSVIERLLPVLVNENGVDETADYASAVDGLIDKLAADLGVGDQKNSNRLTTLFGQLKKISLLILENLREEFSNSEFRPEFYELGFGGHDYDKLEYIDFTLDDGTKVLINGKIDRVDVRRDKTDGKIYVRVVDYKTYGKEFSLDAISEGLDLQLIIYLFALCRPTKKIKELFVSGGEPPVAAGANYFSVKKDITSVIGLLDDKNAMQTASKNNVSRSGFCLDEERHAAYGDAPPKNISVMTGKEIKDLGVMLNDVITKIAENIKSGAVCPDAAEKAETTKVKQYKSPCSYCDYAAICRSDYKDKN